MHEKKHLLYSTNWEDSQGERFQRMGNKLTIIGKHSMPRDH